MPQEHYERSTWPILLIPESPAQEGLGPQHTKGAGGHERSVVAPRASSRRHVDGPVVEGSQILDGCLLIPPVDVVRKGYGCLVDSLGGIRGQDGMDPVAVREGKSTVQRAMDNAVHDSRESDPHPKGQDREKG